MEFPFIDTFSDSSSDEEYSGCIDEPMPNSKNCDAIFIKEDTVVDVEWKESLMLWNIPSKKINDRQVQIIEEINVGESIDAECTAFYMFCAIISNELICRNEEKLKKFKKNILCLSENDFTIKPI